MGSYGVGIGRAWCSQKACEILTHAKEKIERKLFFLIRFAQTVFGLKEF
jgi:hypothetical protein